MQVRVTLTPDVGTFLPSTHQALLQMHVACPGLDPTWTQTLIDMKVAPDGLSAEATIECEPVAPLSLSNHLRIVNPLPAARVRAFRDGVEVASGAFNAPLQVGQLVEAAGERCTVTAISWPHRDPGTGMCAGEVDWQHVDLIPAPDVPGLAPAAQGGGEMRQPVS